MDQQQPQGPTIQIQGILPDHSARYRATFVLQPTGRFAAWVEIEDTKEHFSKDEFYIPAERLCGSNGLPDMLKFTRELERLSAVTTTIPVPSFVETGEIDLMTGQPVYEFRWETPKQIAAPEETERYIPEGIVFIGADEMDEETKEEIKRALLKQMMGQEDVG